MSHPVPPDFDAVYGADADPWRVGSSWYEQRKLSVLLASLPDPRYHTGWEPGCGAGHTTSRLAERVDRLLASDASTVALGLARRRCRHLPGVTFAESALPDSPLPHRVELVVVAEFLYYVPELTASLDTVWASLEPGGHAVFLHWAHLPHDAFRGGSGMHAEIRLDARLRGAQNPVRHRESDFLLDVYVAP
jgi:SAM-dependent methyltransferase